MLRRVRAPLDEMPITLLCELSNDSIEATSIHEANVFPPTLEWRRPLLYLTSILVVCTELASRLSVPGTDHERDTTASSTVSSTSSDLFARELLPKRAVMSAVPKPTACMRVSLPGAMYTTDALELEKLVCAVTS